MSYKMQTFPSPAEEELVDVLSLQNYLIKNPQASFMVKVQSNSMLAAGILPKDLVILDRARQPSNGDIVVAEFNGSWVMRTFYKIRNRIQLLTANYAPNEQPPNFEEELKILGVVTAVARKYH